MLAVLVQQGAALEAASLEEAMGSAALDVLLDLAIKFAADRWLHTASRRAVRVTAMVFLAFSTVLLVFTDATPAGALGVSGALMFFACDFALERHENRIIRLEDD